MIGLVWQIGIYLALWAWQKYMTVKPPGPANAKVQQPSLPHTEEGAPIPLFWGTVRITGPAVVFARRWHADPINQEIGGDSVIVGYRYLLAMQFVLGAPGANFYAPSKPSKLYAFHIGERLVWSGTIDTDDDLRMISKRLLLGGDNAGGGVKGVISYLPGSFTQTNNVFLKKLLLGSGANTDLCYRGQAVVTLYGITGQSWGNDGLHLTPSAIVDDNTPCGFMVGETPNLDGYSFTAFAPTTCSLASTIVNPIGTDANPVCVIYDIITNPWDRVGRSAATIDEDSFLAAALTLKAEGHGFSLIIPGTMDSREAIGLVLEQIDGVLYDDVSTGKMRLALVREDYDVDTLDTLDPSNVLEVVSYSAGTWSSTVNQVRIIFSDRAKKGQDAPAIAQDQANFYATGSKIRSRDIKYPGCTLKALADKLASRELKALSLPLAKLRIAVDRNSYSRRPGDVFKFSWPEYDDMTDVVFRVIKYDVGKLGDERVILDCVQDRWAFKHTVFRVPVGNTTPQTPAPSMPTDYHHTEAPLWLSAQAQLAGRIVDAFDGGRFLVLAVPRTNALGMHSEVAAVVGDDFAKDTEVQPYPGRALVSVTYDRTNEPYDTSTGLVITAVEGWTPTSASAVDIALRGKNLLLLGTEEAGKHEFVTFETATFLGGGEWLLGNVARGCLDTAPLTHPSGTRVWAIHVSTGAALSRVGRVSFGYGATVQAKLPASGLAQVRVSSAEPTVDVVTLTSSLRIARPYPVADLNVGCASLAIADTPSKTPAVLVEGGVDMTWKRRNRLSDTIVRGDAADEVPEYDTTYKIIGKTTGDLGEPDSGEINSVASLVAASQPYSTTAYEDVMLGAAGYGVIQVGARAQAPLRSGNPAAPMLAANWMDATIEVDAPHWRNLLANGRFDQGLDGWTTTAGQPQAVTSSSGLGAKGYYLTGNLDEDDIEVQQTVDIRGFIPGNLTATLQFYHRSSDSGDTCVITLESLSSAGDVIDTFNTGTITPSTTLWGHVELAIPAIDPFAKYLRVTALCHGFGDGAQVLLTEFILRVAQTTSQLLAHPNFDTFNNLTHVIAGWTNVDDYFLGSTGAPPYYVGNTFVTPGNVATSEIKQEVAIPLGWEEQAIAVMEFARTNLNADGDTGEVVLEVLNGGGFVIATQTTGPTVASVGTWDRARLTLEVPEDSVTMRVRLLGVRVSGGNCDTGFGDFNLRLQKHLSPTQVETHNFDVPSSQPVPPDYDYFDRAWPTIAPPALGFYNGSSEQGVRGTEPTLTVDDAATVPPTVKAKFTGAYDATRNGMVTALAYEFPPGCDAGFAVGDGDFAAFTSADAFAVYVQLKSASEARGPRVICGRVGTYGWEITQEDDTGLPVATVQGPGGQAQATGLRSIADRAVRAIAMHYDPITQEVSLVEQDDVTSTSMAATGEIEESAAFFTIGAPTGNGGDMFEGQIANLMIWSGDDVPSTTELQTMITQGLPPASSMVSQTRTDNTLATIIATDDDGVVVARFGNDQFAYGWSAALEVDGGNGLGFPHQPKVNNRITEEDQSQTEGDWHSTGAAVVELAYGAGPEGTKTSFAVTGDNTGGRELRTVLAGASNYKMVAFFARCDEDGHSARLALDNESGVNIDTYDFGPTTEWQIFWHLFDTWDNSTPTCRLRWMGSSDGTPHQLEVCGPFYLSESTFLLTAIPVGRSDSTSCGYDNVGIDVSNWSTQANVAEGEIMVTGVAIMNPFDDAMIIQASGGGSSDFRVLYSSGGSPSFWHYDGGDSFSSTAETPAWDELWTIRGRWCLAGLLDDTSVYAGVLWGNVNGAPADYDRTAPWTLSGNTLDELILGCTEFGDPMPMLLRQVVLRTRERRLATEVMV